MTAFSELFDRYYDVVFRYVLFRMNDRTLAEDVTQETFLRALRRITSVTYQGRDIGAWFVTIARNLIFDHVKSSRYRLESTTSDIVELSPSTHGPSSRCWTWRRTRSCCAASASSTRTSRSASPCGSCRACPSRRRRRSWTATRGR
jgi:RNA polymerase sigma factor (sigma-70 family)